MDEQNLDDLTRLVNAKTREYKIHSSFMECIEKFEIEGKEGLHYSIVMFDVDYFKAINDLFGHDQGSFVLKELGDILKEYQSKKEFIGVIGRYGGDEFLMVLPYNSSKQAKYVADEIRTIVENYEFLDVEKNKFSLKEYITLSMGIGSVEISKIYENISDREREPAVKNATDRIKHEANLALDYAKFLGKNRVEIFEAYLAKELENLSIIRNFFFKNAYKNVSELKAFEQKPLIVNKEISDKIMFYFDFIKHEIHPHDTRTQAMLADNVYRILLSKYNSMSRKEILDIFRKDNQ